ncbi:transcription initiation factor TFIIB [Enteropsectra breve]|nr:transcription initiation factor TFIIB [Enteropsectra breve]KAI5150285.1 transcription initiation factor TFIIB [Enteropsectra breve]
MYSTPKIQPLVPSCTDCGEKVDIIEDYKNGYNVCGKCGCILGNRLIDEGSEWRSFSDSTKADPTRVGSASNPFLDCEQLDTVISAGQGMNSYTLSKIQMKSYMRGPDRALKNGLNLISAFCERAYITKTIINRAQHVFKNVDGKKLLKGKNLEGAVAACIYIACKLENASRTFKEISVITGVQKREIGRCYKLIAQEVDTKGMVPSADIVARFCSDLNLNLRVQSIAAQISHKIQEIGCLTGRSPDSIAAAVIYFVTMLYPDLRDVQRDIQNVTNVTEVTIKNTYKDLLAYKDEILPKEILDEMNAKNSSRKDRS